MNLDKNRHKTQTSLGSTFPPSQLRVDASFSQRVLNRVLCPYQKAKNLALGQKRLIRLLEISWHNLSLITLNLRYHDTSSFKQGKPQVNEAPSANKISLLRSQESIRRRNAASLRKKKSDFQNNCLTWGFCHVAFFFFLKCNKASKSDNRD